jgi:membrane-bound lytic murein transglycosylase B
VADGRRFLEEQREEIKAALGNTGVPPEISVAMLKVESDLGRRPGDHPIFASFATITLLGDSLQWVAQYDTSNGRDLERLQQRAVRRSNWAYKELNLFLQVCERERWHPLEINGSWAGAFGWAQFLPSSYLRCARDGDGDAIIDPFSLKDAVASLAFYLQEAGWSQSRKSQKRALMQYNPSEAYADCIIEYARRLKISSPPAGEKAVEAAG